MEVIAADLDEAVSALFTLNPSALADRWSTYERLRAEAPAYRFGNTVLVTRYDDVRDLLPGGGRVEHGAPSSAVPEAVKAHLTPTEVNQLREIVAWEERWLTSVNGERHAALRALATRVFAARVIAEMRNSIDVTVDRLLSQLTIGEPVDFISDFAYVLPLTVISEMLDIPTEMRDGLHETWRQMLVARSGVAWRIQLPDGLDRAHMSFRAMKEQLLAVLAVRRGRATTTIMSNLLDALGDDRVDEDDVVVLMQLLLSAGHQTTQDLLGNAVATLLTHREVWKRLSEDPHLAPAVVEEVLRFRSPSQDVERFASVDFELRGLRVETGDHVTLVLGSANHDPDRFIHADRFDPDRPDTSRHLAFGHGAHFCLGAALSRMEGTLALAALARRFPRTELVDEHLDWLPSTHFCGLRSLKLALS